jgi:IclR family mhp operon transcriptional activator
VRVSDEPENRVARDTRRIDRILAETRAKGYGARDPSFGGGAYGRQTPDGLAGIAVPLADRTRVHGVINIIWAKSAKEIEDMVRDHLADLQAAATEIVESLRYQTRRM